MAMHAIADENFSVHFDGKPSVQKNKGGLGGRRALNNISNSGKPSALQPSKKHNLKNVLPIQEDLGVSKKAQVTGRKALSDLTNSVKPTQQQIKKTGLKKKSTVAENENLPFSIAEEGFLHNHEECVKSQNKELDWHQFLKIIGLDEDMSSPPVPCNPLTRKSKEESFEVFYEMEEILEPIIEDKNLLSPVCGSPNSPRIEYSMKDYDDFSSFILLESP